MWNLLSWKTVSLKNLSNNNNLMSFASKLNRTLTFKSMMNIRLINTSCTEKQKSRINCFIQSWHQASCRMELCMLLMKILDTWVSTRFMPSFAKDILARHEEANHASCPHLWTICSREFASTTICAWYPKCTQSTNVSFVHGSYWSFSHKGKRQ